MDASLLGVWNWDEGREVGFCNQMEKLRRGGSHTAASPSEHNSCNFETICSRRWHLIQKHNINPQLCVKIRQGEGENEEGEVKSNVYSQSLVVQRA